jgi:hypothetical protein
MIKKSIFIFLIVLISIQLVCAHQPRLVYDKVYVYEQVYNPEISQAFYGELKGLPDYYFINSTKDFDLYLNILAPDITGARTDFSVKIFSGIGNFTLSNQQKWEKFYEEFGGDNYLRGSEFEKNVTEGIYIIEVSNSDNLGRYSLAIGKIESFPLDEALKSIYSVFRLKHDFFNKSYFAFFSGLIGKGVGILFLVFIAIAWGIVLLVKKFRKK